MFFLQLLFESVFCLEPVRTSWQRSVQAVPFITAGCFISLQQSTKELRGLTGDASGSGTY